MSQLEVKEKELNKLKLDSDQLILNQHPAADKIEVILNVFTHKTLYASLNIISGTMMRVSYSYLKLAASAQFQIKKDSQTFYCLITIAIYPA